MKQKPRSRNEDVEFKEKNKRKFIKSEMVLLRVMPELFREFQVIDIFVPVGIDCITYPFTLFNINSACCHIQKFMIALVS